MTTTLQAKSSSGVPYDVVFSVIDGRLTVQCNCKAGALQQQCKHRRALVAGDPLMLFDQSQVTLLQQLTNTEVDRFLAARLAVEESALSALESEKNRIANQEKLIKRNIGHLLARGEL